LARFAGWKDALFNTLYSNNRNGTDDMDLIDAFQTEIQFWEDMLDNQTGDAAPEVLQRMQMAKRLAEQKLSLYSAECYERVN
jgi:hypothetical protein